MKQIIKQLKDLSNSATDEVISYWGFILNTLLIVNM